MALDPARVKALFLAAADIGDVVDRVAFLDRECGGDAELRRRLEELLAALDQPESALERPIAGAAGEVTSDHPRGFELGATVSRRPVADTPAVGTLIAGRYKLLEEIGEGGMGTVWVAEQTQPVKRKVALKLIKPGMDSRSVLARFEAERQALAVMDHPNIAKVLDGGLTESGRPYFVMEYVKGVPITEYCDATRASVPERLNLFVQAAQAVQHAHQKGIIHRDLKPSNILVAPYDGKPVPKVIDFGLAKAMHHSLTEHTLHTAHETVLGTPLYMSPEQAQLNNLDIDTHSDIYSLGVLLYELLTGTTPIERQRFQRAAWDEMRRLIREEEPPKPSTRLSSLSGVRELAPASDPKRRQAAALQSTSLASLAAVRQTEPARLTKLIRGDLDWIVMKALEKDRTRRYETANGFAMDIQRYLSGEPVQAAPPSAAYRIKKFARKHRAGLVTAAAIAFLLTAGITASSWQAYRATRAEGRALAAAAAERKAKNAEADQRRKAELAAAAEKSARQRAEIAEGEAKRDLAKFEAINEFLIKDLLTQAEPANNAFEDHVTLLEVLDRAAAAVGGRFKNDPELEVELRSVIARTYHGLASWAKSEAQWLAVKQIVERSRGPGSEDALAAAAELGHIVVHGGRSKDAIAMLEPAVKELTRIRGRSDLDRLSSLAYLGLAYQTAGRAIDAIPLLEEALRGLTDVLGAEHPLPLQVRANLAGTYGEAGRPADAVANLEELLRISSARLGPEHPDTLTVRGNLARGYMLLGRTAEAHAILEEVVRLLTVRLGPENPNTLYNRVALAHVYSVLGRVNEAMAIHREALKIYEAKLGPDHPHTLMSVHYLGHALFSASRPAEAEPLFRRSLEGYLRLHGPDGATTLDLAKDLGGVLGSLNRPAEAIALLEDGLSRAKLALGDDHNTTLECRHFLADAYRKIGRSAESIALARQNLPLYEAKRGPAAAETLNTRNLLALGYVDGGRPAEAIPLFKELVRRFEKLRGQDGPETITNLLNLAMAYDSANQVADAERTLREILERAGSRPRADVARLAQTKAHLGWILVRQARWAEAEPILRDCLQIREALQPELWATFNTRSQLGASLLGQGRYGEAESLIVAGYEGLRAREPSIPQPAKPRLTEAAARVVKLYEDWGKPELAAEWKKRLGKDSPLDRDAGFPADPFASP
jgi:serine/threonine protein kinase